MREVLLGRIEYFVEIAELIVAATLLVQILVGFSKLEPVTPIVLLQSMFLEQFLNLLKNIAAQTMTFVAFKVELQLERILRPLLLVVDLTLLCSYLFEIKIVKTALQIS